MKVSVIIEWKNQDLAADERATAMLDALFAQWQGIIDSAPSAPPKPRLQATALSPRLELVFIYDGEAARRSLDAQLAGRFESEEDVFFSRLIEGAGLGYYEMKHLGAMEADGDILIFLDSDVVPQPGWMAGLLGAILNEQVQIVCGNTFIDPVGLVGKAFALAWFFPLPACGCGLERDAMCYSNNLAIRAETYRAFPFSEVPGTTRSAMRQLTARLAERGISVYKCKEAQVSHPHPRGLRHFLLRAIVHGRDIYFKTNHDAGRQVQDRHLGAALREVWTRYSKGMKRTVSAYRVVRLNPVLVPTALAIMSVYYGVFTLGILVTHLAPGPMSRGLRI